MQAIEFEAVSENYRIQLPDTAPNGVRMRVLLLWEPPSPSETDLKDLFSSVTEGLTAADLERPRDVGRRGNVRDVERSGVKRLNPFSEAVSE
ncbi:MAG: hypothetical protein MZU95_13680 [Desulfomicrobium escambiense]|nr:hypothetical protein [Desulfomicrobium escambiense]